MEPERGSVRIQSCPNAIRLSANCITTAGNVDSIEIEAEEQREDKQEHSRNRSSDIARSVCNNAKGDGVRRNAHEQV
jgi:hypothetical protein